MTLAATTYPLLEVFWTILIVVGFVVWLWILFAVLADLFRRHDVSGFVKVAWIVFIIVLPYFGVFVYLIFQHQGMAERNIKQTQAAKTELDEYVKSVAGSTDSASQIATAKGLLDSGTINQEEFEKLKQKALATG